MSLRCCEYPLHVRNHSATWDDGMGVQPGCSPRIPIVPALRRRPTERKECLNIHSQMDVQ